MRGRMSDAEIADWMRTFDVLQRWGARPTAKQRADTVAILGREPRSFAAWANERAQRLVAMSPGVRPG